MLTFAIGDVHGSFHSLRRLLLKCAAHESSRAHKFIFLGDYIDRGPDSREVVEFLIRFQFLNPSRVICLCGNHEDALLRKRTASDLTLWLANGGVSTLASYNVISPDELPKKHIDWFRSLPTFHDDGKRFFVHAGAAPDRALAAQLRHDLLWIREPFLSSKNDFGRLVVHGHTSVPGLPDLRSNRLNLDTGAVFGGPLSAAVFDDESVSPLGYLQI